MARILAPPSTMSSGTLKPAQREQDIATTLHMRKFVDEVLHGMVIGKFVPQRLNRDDCIIENRDFQF